MKNAFVCKLLVLRKLNTLYTKGTTTLPTKETHTQMHLVPVEKVPHMIWQWPGGFRKLHAF